MKQLLTSLLDQLGSVIAPPRCLNCLIENTWLCQACAINLPAWQSKTPGIISAGPYSHPVYKRLVGWLKFKGVRALAPIAAALLAPQLTRIAPLAQLQSRAVLIPIPLHPRRQRQRGFNQTQEIAAALTAQTGIPLAPLLVRQQSTWTQSQLPHVLREKNMSNAFRLADPPSWRVLSLSRVRFILLVDDVSTTGSTLLAAEQAFPNVPNQEIWGCVVAQG